MAGRVVAALRLLLAVPLLAIPLPGGVGTATAASAPQAVIVDTDIGDDIDDAFALALLLRSPGLRLDAVSASFGDTSLRARLLTRFLAAAGRGDVPVLAGPPTAAEAAFTQRAFASGGPPRQAAYPDAVEGVLQRLRRAPAGSITLIALAPPTTLGAMIRRDPAAFRRLRQVVMMGGWIRHGYEPRPGELPDREPEYNVAADPAGLRVLLGSGVTLRLMPIDASRVPLRAADRAAIFGRGGSGSTLAATLRALFEEWSRGSPYADRPVLFDVVPVAWLLQTSICTPQPMRLEVDQRGFTRRVAGAPNASVCLSVDAAAVQALLDRAVADR